MNKRTKGQLLLDDYLLKVGLSLDLARKNNMITLEELQPAWEAREKLEKYLSTPQRDSNGLFIKEPAEEL